jgi:hypothetical protein
MKLLVFIQAVLILVVSVSPVSVARFPDLEEPTAVFIDHNQVFITDGVTIYIYSLQDFKLQKKFGKSGPEAQEFKPYEYPNLPIYIDVLPNRIMVESFGRISYFTRKGNFMELIQPRDYFMLAKPVGENFVASRYTRRNNTWYFCLDLYNSRFKKCKELVRLKDNRQHRQRQKLLSRARTYCTSGNQLFIAVEKDFIIDVFDHRGEKLYSIDREYEKIKVTKAYIESRLENAKKIYRGRPVAYEYFKMSALFPDYFPAIAHLCAEDGVLYVRTWKREKEKTEFYLFDMTGKFIKKILLPLAQKNAAEYYPSTFHQKRLYQLVKDRDKKIWELHESIVHRIEIGKE